MLVCGGWGQSSMDQRSPFYICIFWDPFPKLLRSVLYFIVHTNDGNICFGMIGTGRLKNMVRQENEAVRIRELEAKYQINSRNEFHQPTIVRLIATSSNSQADQTGAPAVVMDR